MTWTTRSALAVAFCLTFAACQTPSGSGSSAGSSSGSAAAASAGNWQEVVKSDTQQVFIDVSSLHKVGDAGNVVEASAKTNFASLMMTAGNKPYLSAHNVYRLDCTQRKVAMKSIQAYAETDLQGKVMQKANFYENNLQWMDAPTDTVFAHMIDFACKPAG